MIRFLKQKCGISSLITRKQAYDIAIKYLGEQMRGQIEVIKDLPGNHYGNRLLDSWVVRVPQKGPTITTGAGRFICIAKSTGEIVYDGSDGAE